MGNNEKSINDLDIRVMKNRDITDSDRKLVHNLFEASYENPNHFYTVTTRVLANLPDPDTFVVKGNGTPVGFFSMEISVTEDEWQLFNGVDRNNGDSLLCMGWYPDKPEGW